MEEAAKLRSWIGWSIAGALLWGAVCVLLVSVAQAAGSYVLAVIAYPFGLDFSEGLIWQQAAWVPGPHMYGDIGQPPYVGFEYPPFYHIAVRLLAGIGGLDMLRAGRVVAAASSLALCVLLGLCVHLITRRIIAGVLAALLPAIFLPVLAWAPLMRVDMMACAFTYAGILLGLAALRRSHLLYGAILCFVAACYTKQTFLAAPVAMLAIHALRDPRHAFRAAMAGLAAGLAMLALLCWQTDDGFLRHILSDNVNRFNLAFAMHQIGNWLLAYMPAGIAVLLSLALAWHPLIAAQPAGGIVRTVRSHIDVGSTAFLTLYLALATLMLLLAGKTGASMNYFIEFFCLWCVWLGCLAALCLRDPLRTGPLPACVACLLLLQIWPIPGAIARMHAEQLAPERARQARQLLGRVRAMKGPILSDDMVLVKQAGKEVEIEPAIIAELAHRGSWDEHRLIDMLLSHHYDAVVTAYGPGDPTFESRYLPATQAAMLKAYPVVVTYGDYRLRLPALE